MAEQAAIRRTFSRAARRYEASAFLQRQVSDRLLDLLPVAAAQVQEVLDLGCGTGFASARLRARHPGAKLLSADLSPAMLAAHEPEASAARVCADAHALPLAGESVDLVFSSLMVQWCDLSRALSECWRVLRPGGHLCFSTVLEGTLREIDVAFAPVDRHRHTLAFIDEAGLGETLVATGFQVDRIVRQTRVEYFADARGVLQSNRDIGASRVPEGRRRGALGRAAWKSVCMALESMRTPEGLPLTYELVWVVAHRPGDEAAW